MNITISSSGNNLGSFNYYKNTNFIHVINENFTFNNNLNIPDVFLQNAFTRKLYSRGPVIIEDNVHIGENCTIMPGVTIGHNSVISSNTTVSKSIKPYSLVSGNPAKSISFNI